MMFKLALMVFALVAAVNADDSSVIVNGANKLSMEIYKEMIRSNRRSNLVFSPHSVETILSLAYCGAEGRTAEEMRQVLHLADKRTTALGASQLTDKMQSTGPTTFQSVNKIYTSVPVNEKFQLLSNAFYKTQCESVSFSDSSRTARKINRWVEDNTNGKIRNLVTPDSLSADSAMVLINAVYFFGQWENEFDVSPVPLKFATYRNRWASVPKMVRSPTPIIVVKNQFLDAEIFHIPYTLDSGAIYNFLLVLPNKLTGLPSIEAKMPFDTATLLETGNVYENEENIGFELPKFKIESQVPLKQILNKLGMKAAFGSDADFSFMTNQTQLQISNVVQKAFIDVNEKGTEAAAATSAQYTNRMIGSALPTRSVVVNRPFMFAIYEEITKSIVFMGRVVDL